MLRRLYKDEGGQALLMISIMIPVMLGFVGLAIEGGRFMMVHSELQNLADAAAIAGAQKLDGTANSIQNAIDTVSNTWAYNNVPTMSNDGQVAGSSQISEVHVCDTLTSTSCHDTTNYADARYVRVVTVARGIIPAFLTAVGAGTETTTATATAESQLVACNVQPLMLCNPFEPSGIEFADAVKGGTVKAGMQFHLKVLNDPGSGGSNQSYAPGDFGLLDPPNMNSSGANTIRDLLSQQSPKFCYVDKVSPRTGQAVQKVNDGINVRFDVPISGNQNDPALDVTTAPDVIKGYQPDANYCQTGHYTDQPTWRLPRDSGTPTAYGNMTIGSGNIDTTAAAAYMAAHFGTTGWQAGTSAGSTNRYNQYIAEQSMAVQAGTESKGPICQSVSTAGTDRRVISVAVVDCIANGIKGNSVASVASNTYIDIFLTEPSSSGEVWGEFMRVMTPVSDGSKIKQIVQLVRDR